MKKEVKAIIAVVLAVWCFFMGFELGSYKEKKAASANVPQTTISAPTTTAAPETTVAPTTEAPTTTAPDAGDQTTGNATGETTTAANNQGETTTAAQNSADPSSMSKEEILAAVTKAINGVKNEQNMTAKKDETVTINLTDLSVPSAKDTINGIIQGLAGQDLYTYTFVGGQGTGIDQDGKATDDGATVTPMQVIPPTGREFALTADGVKSATAKKEGDLTTYEIVLVEENTTFSNPQPTHHYNAYGYLDITSLSIPTVTITDANMHYPGTVITVQTNADGKATMIHFDMKMSGDGAARILVASGNASFEGGDNEKWEFTY